MNYLPPLSADDKLKCAERELAMRKRVYPRWVDSGKMKPEKANAEIICMQAIVDDYKAQVARERLL